MTPASNSMLTRLHPLRPVRHHRRPTERTVTPPEWACPSTVICPRCDTSQLRRYYRAAGRPPLREISQAVERLWDTALEDEADAPPFPRPAPPPPEPAPRTSLPQEDPWASSGSRYSDEPQYLESVDWADVNRALRVFERLAPGFEPQQSSRFLSSLRRDGYVLDEEAGHITPAGPRFAPESLKNVSHASAIRQQLGRIQHAILDDPALAIGSAKELIESTAKVVLKERGLPVDDKADLPALVRDAQQARGLHPSAAVPGPDGSGATITCQAERFA
jgi:hypothetical protein